MSTSTQVVDHSGLKVGQAATILLLVLAFIVQDTLGTLLVAFVALAQWLSGFDLPFAPYKLLYTKLIKPRGWVKPNPQPDHSAPHRFALIVGALFNTVATLALLSGAPALGWGLVWVVIILANLNFWLNFCLGCWMYYQLNKLGIPGFIYSPVQK